MAKAKPILPSDDDRYLPWVKSAMAMLAPQQPAVTTDDYDRPLGGKHGILSGLVCDTDAPPPPLKSPRERRAQAVAEQERLDQVIKLGLEHETSIAAEDREQDANDGLEAAIRPYLKDELAAEINSGGTAEQRRQDFAKLKACCDRWGLPLNLPHEPVPWAGVAAFLIEEGERGIEHVTRLRDSIRFSHRSMNLSDPTSDHVINAILRSIANRKDLTPAS
jgi:hypothetical protein